MGNSQDSSPANRRGQRGRLRAQGLRPVEIWVPDVNSPVFCKAARAQSRLVAASAGTADAQAFIDAIGVGGPVD
jgi:hypothetical protein